MGHVERYPGTRRYIGSPPPMTPQRRAERRARLADREALLARLADMERRLEALERRP